MSATELTTTPHATPALAEADRLMIVCNSCRYCEGLCAVFPAMEIRRTFLDADLNYLANLCHSCGACYDDCQFSPPHEFDVNVPKALAVVRNDSYAAFAWPGALAGLFARNGLAVSLITAAAVTLFMVTSALLVDPDLFWGRHTGPTTFYDVIPHNVMVALFGAAFLYAILAITLSARRFWIGTEAPAGAAGEPVSLWQACRDSLRLRYLDGGKGGCETPNGRDRRKDFHHATFYGFMLCFASTSVATLYHYLLGREAPYPWYDLPVVLGTLGGIGLVVGPVGLLAAKLERPAQLRDTKRTGMDVAFIALLFLTGLSGLALLALRDTGLMGPLLALHLGIVMALFVTLPYGKFVHGIYRFLALVRYANESRRFVPGDES